jgi:ATP-dependent protease HslVU (ClpYQ) peptidase subunit
MSSVGSTSSYVSFRGEDGVDLNDALDMLYKDIQQNLNLSQCSVRNMARLREDDEFKDCVPIHFAVLDYVDILNELFNELKKVSSDVLGKTPKDLKDWYKEECLKRKELIKKQKEEKKEEQKQMKDMEKQMKGLEIIKE